VAAGGAGADKHISKRKEATCENAIEQNASNNASATASDNEMALKKVTI